MVSISDKIPSYLLDKMFENVYISDDMSHLVMKFKNLICLIRLNSSDLNYSLTINGKEYKIDSSTYDNIRVNFGEEILFTIPVEKGFNFNEPLHFVIRIGCYNDIGTSWELIADFTRTPV